MLHPILSFALAMNLLFSIGTTEIVPYPYSVTDPALSGYTQEADGRYTGGTATGSLGATMTNQFFSYRVNSAQLAASYEGQKPAEGNVYLVAELMVTNQMGVAILMFSDDFQVQWGEGDEDYGYPIPKFAAAQMEDEYEIQPDVTLGSTVVYEVPIPEGDSAEYNISYQEVYEDDVVGNTFFVYFELPTDAVAVM
jgi:hypothetical protein